MALFRAELTSLHYRGLNDPTGRVAEQMGNPKHLRRKPHQPKPHHTGVRVPERPLSWTETHTPTPKPATVVIFQLNPAQQDIQRQIEELVARKNNGDIPKSDFRHELQRLRSKLGSTKGGE